VIDHIRLNGMGGPAKTVNVLGVLKR
jgi:hypothetical protein